MKDGNDYHEGETFRSKCGRARITYHPDWDSERPWVSYIRGTASRHYPGPYTAMVRMRDDYGYQLDLTRQPQETVA